MGAAGGIVKGPAGRLETARTGHRDAVPGGLAAPRRGTKKSSPPNHGRAGEVGLDKSAGCEH